MATPTPSAGTGAGTGAGANAGAIQQAILGRGIRTSGSISTFVPTTAFTKRNTTFGQAPPTLASIVNNGSGSGSSSSGAATSNATTTRFMDAISRVGGGYPRTGRRLQSTTETQAIASAVAAVQKEKITDAHLHMAFGANVAPKTVVPAWLPAGLAKVMKFTPTSDQASSQGVLGAETKAPERASDVLKMAFMNSATARQVLATERASLDAAQAAEAKKRQARVDITKRFTSVYNDALEHSAKLSAKPAKQERIANAAQRMEQLNASNVGVIDGDMATVLQVVTQVQEDSRLALSDADKDRLMKDLNRVNKRLLGHSGPERVDVSTIMNMERYTCVSDEHARALGVCRQDANMRMSGHMAIKHHIERKFSSALGMTSKAAVQAALGVGSEQGSCAGAGSGAGAGAAGGDHGLVSDEDEEIGTLALTGAHRPNIDKAREMACTIVGKRVVGDLESITTQGRAFMLNGTWFASPFTYVFESNTAPPQGALKPHARGFTVETGRERFVNTGTEQGVEVMMMFPLKCGKGITRANQMKIAAKISERLAAFPGMESPAVTNGSNLGLYAKGSNVQMALEHAHVLNPRGASVTLVDLHSDTQFYDLERARVLSMPDTTIRKTLLGVLDDCTKAQFGLVIRASSDTLAAQAWRKVLNAATDAATNTVQWNAATSTLATAEEVAHNNEDVADISMDELCTRERMYATTQNLQRALCTQLAAYLTNDGEFAEKGANLGLESCFVDTQSPMSITTGDGWFLSSNNPVVNGSVVAAAPTAMYCCNTTNLAAGEGPVVIHRGLGQGFLVLSTSARMAPNGKAQLSTTRVMPASAARLTTAKATPFLGPDRATVAASIRKSLAESHNVFIVPNSAWGTSNTRREQLHSCGGAACCDTCADCDASSSDCEEDCAGAGVGASASKKCCLPAYTSREALESMVAASVGTEHHVTHASTLATYVL